MSTIKDAAAETEPVTKALALVAQGGSLATILTTLVKVSETEVPAISTELPKTVKVTGKIVNAVATMGLLTVDHVHLTVSERRPLTEAELDTLSVERDAIDALLKYAEARKAAHKVMLYNHLDAKIDASEGEKPPLDASGRYLTKASVFAQGGARHFDRQLGEGAPYVTDEALNNLAESGVVDGFGHDEYLKCTTEVRVVDEAKITLAMRHNPAVIAALHEAVQPGTVSSSFYHRAS